MHAFSVQLAQIHRQKNGMVHLFFSDALILTRSTASLNGKYLQKQLKSPFFGHFLQKNKAETLVADFGSAVKQNSYSQSMRPRLSR